MTARDLAEERERQRRAMVRAARSHAAAVEEYVRRLGESLRAGRAAGTSAPAERPGERGSAELVGALRALAGLSLSQSSVDQLLQRIALLATEAIEGCQAAGVSLVADGRVQARVATDPLVGRIDEVEFGFGEGPCVEALGSGEPRLSASLATERRWPRFARAATEHGVQSTMSIPLLVDGVPIGSLNLYSGQPDAFDPAAQELAAALAEHVAAVLADARAYGEQQRTVAVLQRRLLPRELPRRQGMQLAVRYLPSSQSLTIGGDWYDAVELGGDLLGLTIGDVAGHGIDSAAVMGQLRAVLRAYALEGHPPARVLALGHRFLGGLDPDLLATACHLTLEGDSGLVTWASAGHPPPAVLGPDRTARFLEAEPGPPLGAPAEPTAAEGQTRLEPGSLLVLYTDGLIERRGEAIDTGLARLAAALAASPQAPEACLDHLVARLLATAPDDDVALLAVRR
jgi:serine phosphatase RsbU (regulator of sigma subunit)